MQKLSKVEKIFWTVAILALLALRFFYMAGPLDEPSWRQAWCAFHAREVSRLRDPNWFANYVNFRGEHTLSYWTLPLYENMVALAYRAIGRENLAVARGITLFSYVVAAALLFLVGAELFGRRAGAYAALAFFAMPLGIFYSRAVHYEALLLALSYGYLLAGLRWVERPSWGKWLVVSLVGALAALIKPTFLMWCLPVVAVWAVVQNPRGWWRAGTRVLLFAVVPVVAAVGHHLVRLSWEGKMANTPLYADPYNAVYAKSWFLGSLAEKWMPAYWYQVGREVFWLILTPAGFILVPFALAAWRRPGKRGGLFALASWFAGLAVYTVAFLRIVATHDYWRLPFLAPLALALGLAADELLIFRATRGEIWKAACCVGIAAMFAFGIKAGFRRGPYFAVDWQRIRTGEVIQRNTAANDLVLSTCLGRSTGPTDPRILYYADRLGWANRIEDLQGAMLKAYRDAGADILAVLVTPEHLPLSGPHAWMLSCPHVEEKMAPPATGAVYLYRFAELTPWVD